MNETEMKAEIERLRELLLDNGINPDPSLPEPFGPPTAMMWGIQQRFAKSAAICAKQDAEQMREKMFMTDPQWTSEQYAQFWIRVPRNFKVTAA